MILMRRHRRKRLILAIDSLSGLAGGSLTWLFAHQIQAIHHWSPEFSGSIALANLAYGIYSGTMLLVLTVSSRLPRGLVAVLVAGNGLWALHCLCQAWRLRAEASLTGIGHLFFESAYVAVLAWMEAKVFFPPPSGAIGTARN